MSDLNRTATERRNRVWNEAKNLLDDVAAQGRDMSAEENAKWSRMNAEIDDLDVEIRERTARGTRANEAAKIREAQSRYFTSADDSSRRNRERDILRDFLRGRSGYNQLEVDVTGVQRERDLVRQGASAEEIRALAWDTGSVASAVPTTMARTMYEYMEASIAMFRAPTTKIVTSSGEPMVFPYLGAHAIATQVSGQGTALAGTDPTFAKMTLDAWKYGQIARVAEEVLADAAVDVGSFLGRDIGRGLGRLVDTDLVIGSGTGKPRGLMVAAAAAGAGSVHTGGSLITPTVEKLLDTMYVIADEYRGPSSGWLMRDSTAGTIRKLRDGAGGTIGAFLWTPSVIAGQPDQLLGYPTYVDPNVAAQGSNARVLSFADFSAYYIRQVGNPVIELDRSVYFASDEVAVRGKWRIDGDLVDLAATSSLVQNV